MAGIALKRIKSRITKIDIALFIISDDTNFCTDFTSVSCLSSIDNSKLQVLTHEKGYAIL